MVERCARPLPCARRVAAGWTLGSWAVLCDGPRIGKGRLLGRLQHARVACARGPARACHPGLKKHAAAPSSTGLRFDFGYWREDGQLSFCIAASAGPVEDGEAVCARCEVGDSIAMQLFCDC